MSNGEIVCKIRWKVLKVKQIIGFHILETEVSEQWQYRIFKRYFFSSSGKILKQIEETDLDEKWRNVWSAKLLFSIILRIFKIIAHTTYEYLS